MNTPRSVRVRRWRRDLLRRQWPGYRYAVPVLHPAEDRWARAALGDHMCRRVAVTVLPDGTLHVDTALPEQQEVR